MLVHIEIEKNEIIQIILFTVEIKKIHFLSWKLKNEDKCRILRSEMIFKKRDNPDTK